jgi:MoaA/NifB/PqqE/SkfB family radical SAM enzyme
MLNLQSVSFLAADVTSAAFGRFKGGSGWLQANVALTAEETNELENEIELLIEELPDLQGFVLETPEKLRRIIHHFRANLGLVELEAPRCNAPWVSVVIESDGTVRPCFFHRPVGNIREQSLSRIFNGVQSAEFRRMLDTRHDPVCQRCVCSLFFKDRSMVSGSRVGSADH